MEPSVEIRFLIPRSWRDELKIVAALRAISLADLLRLIVRDFMSARFSEDEQEILGLHKAAL